MEKQSLASALHLIARVFALSQPALARVLRAEQADLYAIIAAGPASSGARPALVRRIRRMSGLATRCSELGQMRKGGETLASPRGRLVDLLSRKRVSDCAVVGAYSYALQNETILRSQAADNAKRVAKALGDAFRANRHTRPALGHTDPMKVPVCPHCGTPMQHDTWEKEIVNVGSLSTTVESVSGFRCLECGEAIFDAKSYDRVVAASDALVRAARG